MSRYCGGNPLAVNDGFGRAALRSARTLYECVVFARFIYAHPEKVDGFLDTFHAQWAKVIQNVPAEYRPSEMHNILTEKVSKYAAGKMVSMGDLKWTGENTLEMAREVGLSYLHSSAFDYASAYIHPSAVFLVSTLSNSGPAPSIFRVGEAPQEQEAMIALQLAHELILNALELRLKCSPSDDRRACFDECKADFANIWGCTPASGETT